MATINHSIIKDKDKSSAKITGTQNATLKVGANEIELPITPQVREHGFSRITIVKKVYAMIRDWLDRCSKVAPLQRGVNYDNIIRSELQNAIKSGWLPMSKNRVKEMLPELHQILFGKLTA